MPKFRVRKILDVWADIEAETEEQAIEEFEVMEHQSPTEPELKVEKLDGKPRRTLVINVEGSLKEINTFCAEVGEISNKYKIKVDIQ